MGTQRPNVSKYDRSVPLITKLQIETGVTKWLLQILRQYKRLLSIKHPRLGF